MIIQGTDGSILSEGWPSVLDNLSFIDHQGKKDIAADQPYDGFAYTLMDIKEIVENNDMDAYMARRNQSRRVMTVLDTARKSANIVFAADWQA